MTFHQVYSRRGWPLIPMQETPMMESFRMVIVPKIQNKTDSPVSEYLKWLAYSAAGHAGFPNLKAAGAPLLLH